MLIAAVDSAHYISLKEYCAYWYIVVRSILFRMYGVLTLILISLRAIGLIASPLLHFAVYKCSKDAPKPTSRFFR